MKPEILVRVELPEADRVRLAEGYVVHYAPTAERFAALGAEARRGVAVVATNAGSGLSHEALETLPNLKLVLCLGAGIDNIDLATLRARGIPMASGAGTNAFAVADHAIGLALALLRNIVAGDNAVRAGRPLDVVAPRPTLTGKRVGILGLGAIGMAIARRAAAFDTDIAYHNRKPRADVSWPHCDSPASLAARSDLLFVALPGVPATQHIVDAAVLAALGAKGRLVNVGRGAAVDTAALVRALADGAIAGAALDVYEGEPQASEAMLAAPNLILTPHIAGDAHEALAAASERMFVNLAAFFAGREFVSRIL